MNKFAPLHPKVNTLLHGADYNPEQWENDPDIIDKDIAMMQQAKCNVMSVGIFSWAKLEPREGVFDFARLDTILDKLYAAGIHVFLATPSGARPAWMSQRYPQVLRVGARSGAGPARRPSQSLYVVAGLSREDSENQ
ncbi:beta-galactosidase [Escherichia coli]